MTIRHAFAAGQGGQAVNLPPILSIMMNLIPPPLEGPQGVEGEALRGLPSWHVHLSVGALSWQLPFRDIEAVKPALLTSFWYSWEQYWLPRSECWIQPARGLRKPKAFLKAS